MKQSLQVLPTAVRKATGNYGDCETLRSRLDIPARGGMGALAGRTRRLTAYWNVDAQQQQQQRANRCNRWLVVPAAQPAQVPGTRSGCDVAQSELLSQRLAVIAEGYRQTRASTREMTKQSCSSHQ
ncbi:hypothetical protein KC330_g145 [Hortaea werneckii]|nr:hypothetical protein KC330_g145 [Hortaea werneckii]